LGGVLRHQVTVRNWDLLAAFVSVFGICFFLFFRFVSHRFLCEILEALMAESKREREADGGEREKMGRKENMWAQ
jgi:hypothetical protein